MGDVISAMKDEGIKVAFAEDDIFQCALSSAMRDPAWAEQLTRLIAYQNVAQGKAAVPLGAKNEYTSQALYRMNWSWPEASRDYLHRFLSGMIQLGYFGEIS